MLKLETEHEAIEFIHWNRFRLKQEPAGTTKEQLVYAKKLYESAFHPDSGDLQNVFGKFSHEIKFYV